MKLSKQLKEQLLQVESSLEICQQILNKKSEEEETEEWLENWSRWTDWHSVLFFDQGVVLQNLNRLAIRPLLTHMSAQQYSCNKKAP